jgi:starch phosphorylase
MSRLIIDAVGDKWICNPQDHLRLLEGFAEDGEFKKAWHQMKYDNKQDLARLIKKRTNTIVNPASMFDIQVKRIHEYKRQHLNALHIITHYLKLKNNLLPDAPPRTVIFGGKAAPGYFMAKLIIKLINSIAEIINRDPEVADRLKVVFFPDFNVKNGQHIYPAADLSEQISTAGKEASGTGNMKFSMNGALTIGTLDGANVEIRQEVGAENFFLFGLNAAQVENLKASGYCPMDYYKSNEELKTVIDLIQSGFFSGGDADLFKPLIHSLLYEDKYMLMADYQSYIDCQERISELWQDQEKWTRMSLLNVARIGKFSSDRAIKEYCRDIWKIDLP